MTFLIVEDNPKTAAFLKTNLEAEGIEIALVDNSYTAMSYLLNNHVDKIISDFNLSYGDGMHLAKEVKAEEKTKSIPFLMYSSREIPENLVNIAKRFGVDVCIPETEPEKILAFAKANLL